VTDRARGLGPGPLRPQPAPSGAAESHGRGGGVKGLRGLEDAIKAPDPGQQRVTASRSVPKPDHGAAPCSARGELRVFPVTGSIGTPDCNGLTKIATRRVGVRGDTSRRPVQHHNLLWFAAGASCAACSMAPGAHSGGRLRYAQLAVGPRHRTESLVDSAKRSSAALVPGTFGDDGRVWRETEQGQAAGRRGTNPLRLPPAGLPQFSSGALAGKPGMSRAYIAARRANQPVRPTRVPPGRCIQSPLATPSRCEVNGIVPWAWR